MIDRPPLVEPARPNRRSILGIATGAALGVAALVLFFFSVVNIDRERTIQRELHPWPDGPEYLEAANNLVQNGRYVITIAGEQHPPRYPPGYSLVLAAAILLGVESLDAPFLVNQIAALFLIVLVWAALGRGGHWIRPGLGVLLLVTMPAFSILARSPLSDLPSACFTLVAILTLYHFSKNDGHYSVLAGSALLGVSSLFRVANLLLLPFVLAAAACARTRRTAWLMLVATGLGTLPLLFTNWLSFGSPLATGYDYWLLDPGPAFSWRYLPAGLVHLGRELIQQEQSLNTASIYGANSYVGPGLILLALLKVALRQPSRCTSFFGVAFLTSILLTLSFQIADLRFLFPQLILLVLLAAWSSSSLLRQTLARRQPVASAGIILLMAWAVIGWPGARSDTELGDLLRPRPLYLNVSPENLSSTLKSLLDSPSLILSDLPSPLMNLQTGPLHLNLPLLDRHEYRFNPAVFQFSSEKRHAAIIQALAEGRRVLAYCTRCQLAEVLATLPPPETFSWETSHRLESGGGIAQLRPARP